MGELCAKTSLQLSTWILPYWFLLCTPLTLSLTGNLRVSLGVGWDRVAGGGGGGGGGTSHGESSPVVKSSAV